MSLRCHHLINLPNKPLDKMPRCSLHALIFFSVSLALILCHCIVVTELYSSVEELSQWTSTRTKVLELVDSQIKLEKDRLQKLEVLNKTIADQTDRKYSRESLSDNRQKLYDDDQSSPMLHPVEAYITIHRTVKALEDVYSLFYDEEESSKLSEKDRNFINSLERLRLDSEIPSYDDFVGCGKALIRLQVVYDLSIDDLALGLIKTPANWTVGFSQNHLGLPMNSEDCHELGRISYEDKLYPISMLWFSKSLTLMEKERDQPDQDIDFMLYRKIEALEYMAFSAYNMGNLDKAKELTELWLELDTGNERALNNLEYYEEELNQPDFSEKLGGSVPESVALPEEAVYSINTSNFETQDYVITKDKTVSMLCRRTLHDEPTGYSCSNSVTFERKEPDTKVKTEILHKNPDIIRIHDIISESEASQLKDLATPRLQRSTVFANTGLVTTEFRVGKTAWLSRNSVPIVDIIEQRIARILNLNLEGSENMQIVNYGIGGFYGPHLDSSRATRPDDWSDSERVGELANNDRLATVLIYLNGVEAGGSTVFPRLNLTVEPIERSAVIWYNLLKNGLSDSRTLHAGCPVLLGSKWIGTIWIRETANSFSRPCSLARQE